MNERDTIPPAEKLAQFTVLIWHKISDDKAWRICARTGETPPYAGYAKQIKSNPPAWVRCKRDDTRGTYFEEGAPNEK